MLATRKSQFKFAKKPNVNGDCSIDEQGHCCMDECFSMSCYVVLEAAAMCCV